MKKILGLALILVALLAVPTSTQAGIEECVTIEVGGHVADGCIWTDYWTCCSGYCISYSIATYCPGG